MAGYLEAYGAGEERRARIVKRSLIYTISTLIVLTVLYLWFRNYSQERVVKHFFSLLQEKRYQEAYALWGCTQDHPCKYWGPEKFNEEWGPSSPYSNVPAIKVTHEDSCGNGVVFDIESPKNPPEGLFVDKESNTLSYAPQARCPGPHWQIWEYIKSRFS